MERLDEVWVLGATGRTGALTAAIVASRGARTVLVGRNAARLEATAADTGAARALTASDPLAMAAAIRREKPAVVVNTVGPFTTTAELLAESSLPTTSYLDIANDMTSASAIIDLDARARQHGRTLVTGAGFGVVGTEAPLALLCQGGATPTRVRVDSVASMAIPAGPIGQALSDTMIGMLSESGRRVADGRLVQTPIGSSPLPLHLPDGGRVTTGAWPSGDLIAAHRTSGASEIIAATTEVPTNRAARIGLPVARALLRIGALRRFTTHRMAGMKISDRPMPRPSTWGHAWAEWADGRTQHAWLRAGEAGDFTARVLAESTLRILNGHAIAGAGTPVQMLGLDLVEAAGGEVYLA